jgi:hypothetical protein
MPYNDDSDTLGTHADGHLARWEGRGARSEHTCCMPAGPGPGLAGVRRDSHEDNQRKELTSVQSILMMQVSVEG